MDQKISLISSQFLQGVPIHRIEFNDVLKKLDWNGQEKLLQSTILHELNVKWPLKVEYQISFIKEAIRQLEEETAEIHDLLYEQLAAKMNEIKPEFSYKHFLLKSETDQRIRSYSMKESNSFIRDGTTGLKLWPAAIKLGDFVAQNPHIFEGRSVLELGSGASGFIGLTLATLCRPKQVYLSDCHELVIKNLIDNVALNLKELEFEELIGSVLIRRRIRLTAKDVELAILNLEWGNIGTHENELKDVIKPEILLAADVIYDEDIFDDFFQCLDRIFAISSPTFFLSQSIRNQATFEKFTQLLHSKRYHFVDQAIAGQTVFKAESDSDIKIVKITKQQVAACS